MTLKFYLGLFLEIFSSFSIVWCCIMLIAVAKLAFISRRSPIYVISFANIIADTFTLFNYIVYLAPCIITNSFIFSGEKYNPIAIVLAVEAASCWFIISFSHILVALNRLVVICLNSSKIFTYRAVFLLVLLIFPISLAMAIYVELVTPCCMFLHDHEKMSFTYEFKPGVPNYSNIYFHTPVNISTSTFCAVCYFFIYFHIKKASSTHASNSSTRRRKEYIYALQFFGISVFHLLIWVSLRLFPLIIDSSQPGATNWFTFTSICQILSSLATTVVYTFFNSEIQSILFQFRAVGAGSSVVRVTQMSISVRD